LIVIVLRLFIIFQIPKVFSNYKFSIMLKNILQLEGVQELKKKQQLSIHGGSEHICYVGPFVLDCSTNTDGRCTCMNGRCVKGPDQHCR